MLFFKFLAFFGWLIMAVTDIASTKKDIFDGSPAFLIWLGALICFIGFYGGMIIWLLSNT